MTNNISKRFLATIQYDGSKYSGYQKQPDQETIQSCLENVLTIINKKEVSVHGSGRTDAKVHALGQRIHFDLEVQMNCEQIKKAMNSLLPDDIYVKKVEEVESTFHARFDVQKKSYIYKINLGEYNPIEKDYVLQYNQMLNIEDMKKASTYLLGTRNFKAFTKVDEEKETYVRTIYEINFEKQDDILTIQFSGSGFLRYMIRNMVGTLIEIGEGKREVSSIQEILESENRVNAGKTAPACGLYLKEVIY